MQEKKHNWTTNLKQKIFTLTRNQLHAVKPNYHILPIKLRKKIFVIENHQGDFQGRKKKHSHTENVGSCINLYLIMRLKRQHLKAKPFGGLFNILSFSLRKISELSSRI